MEDYQKAEIDYINGMKYKDIAEKYGKALSTVKSWKQRYKWNKSKTEVDLKNSANSTRTKSKGTRTKEDSTHTKAFVDKQIEISNNSDLTEREEMFCYYYSQYPNQTKAYMRAYENDNYNTSQTGAWGLMRKPKIIKRIRELKRGKQEMALLEVADVVNELKRQAFADVADYLEYGTEIVKEWHQEFNEDTNEFEDKPVIDPETGEQAFYHRNYVRFKETENTDTTLLKSVKLNKEGHVEIEMYDKQKALTELLKFINDKGMPQQKLEKLKADTEISQSRAKMMSDSDDKVVDAVATLMNAFSGAARDDSDD